MRQFTQNLFVTTLVAFTLSGPAHAIGPDEYMPDVTVDTPMTGEELETVFRGKTHRGSYTFLNRDITTFAFTETTAADGSIRHVQQHRVDTGTWSLTGNVICYDYDDQQLLQACFNIYARGNCYYHYQVSTQGLAKFGFTARSVIEGETPNCEPSLV